MSSQSRLGQVKTLFRFPVKSMGGESLQEIHVSKNGFELDRAWAMYDTQAGEIRGGKKIPELMQFNASYKNIAAGQVSPEVEIQCPDGSILRSGDETCAAEISALVGRELALSPLQPASNREHYRQARKMDTNTLRETLGLAEGEPVPDFSEMPLSMLAKLQVYVTPPGSYFDAYPIHLLTTSSLKHMEELSGNGNFDVHRFRPSIFVDSEGHEGFAEFDWCHRKIQIGEVILQVDGKTPRCSMPARAQRDIPADKALSRQLFEHAERNLGVYANVLQEGRIRVGDEVSMLPIDDSKLVARIKVAQRKLKKKLVGMMS